MKDDKDDVVKVQQHYSRLGIKSRRQGVDLNVALLLNPNHKNVIDYQRIRQRYDECGDLDSADAFYDFIYSTAVPTLDMSFADAYQSSRYDLDEIVLTAMAEFCDGATSVLDAGCGDGVVLTFLATELPETQFVGIDRLPKAVAKSQSRIKELDLSNASVASGDAFELPSDLLGQFDRVIMRCVVDDVRQPNTPWSDTKFDIAYKLTEVSKALTDDGWSWLGISFDREHESEIRYRINKEINETGLTVARIQWFDFGSPSLLHFAFEVEK